MGCKTKPTEKIQVGFSVSFSLANRKNDLTDQHRPKKQAFGFRFTMHLYRVNKDQAYQVRRYLFLVIAVFKSSPDAKCSFISPREEDGTAAVDDMFWRCEGALRLAPIVFIALRCASTHEKKYVVPGTWYHRYSPVACQLVRVVLY